MARSMRAIKPRIVYSACVKGGRIMRTSKSVLLAVVACAAAASFVRAATEPPAPWAYGFDTPAPPPGTPPPAPAGRGGGRGAPPPPDPMQYTVPGSEVKM